MPNRVVAAIMTAVGLLSSTFALAEVTNGSASKSVSDALSAPAVVAANLAIPLAVETFGQPAAEQPAETLVPADRPATAHSLAELVRQAELSDPDDAEARCLATTIYYEARSESLDGQLAVANVVLERAKSGRFPTSLCGVVTQPGQFSFVRGGRLPATPSHAGQWRTAQAIAQIALDGSWSNPAEGALFFHSTRVSPRWARARVTRIGGHIFYR
jgi:spore germination cell wall hydrolase CwlJ-like protein